MRITYEQSPEAVANGVHAPEKGHHDDSGFDIYAPHDIELSAGERKTVDLQVKFELEAPGLAFVGMEAQVRPKSGRSKAGIDVELGTIDQGYRNYIGATVTNTGAAPATIRRNEKLCQVVFAPVFNTVELTAGKVGDGTSRGLGGFGSTGIGPKKKDGKLGPSKRKS